MQNDFLPFRIVGMLNYAKQDQNQTPLHDLILILGYFWQPDLYEWHFVTLSIPFLCKRPYNQDKRQIRGKSNNVIIYHYNIIQIWSPDILVYTYVANLIWSFFVTYCLPLDLRYSSKLPFDINSVTIFMVLLWLSNTIPRRQTRLSCCKELK